MERSSADSVVSGSSFVNGLYGIHTAGLIAEHQLDLDGTALSLIAVIDDVAENFVDGDIDLGNGFHGAAANRRSA